MRDLTYEHLAAMMAEHSVIFTPIPATIVCNPVDAVEIVWRFQHPGKAYRKEEQPAEPHRAVVEVCGIEIRRNRWTPEGVAIALDSTGKVIGVINLGH